MIIFTKPKKLNGIQLRQELRNEGINIGDDRTVIIIDNELHLDIDAKDQEKANDIVSAHVGIDKEPTIEDKLASVGLNLNDLKIALGL
jgi:hypothetical protein